MNSTTAPQSGGTAQSCTTPADSTLVGQQQPGVARRWAVRAHDHARRHHSRPPAGSRSGRGHATKPVGNLPEPWSWKRGRMTNLRRTGLRFPPSDRLWRHPSEVGGAGAAASHDCSRRAAHGHDRRGSSRSSQGASARAWRSGSWPSPGCSTTRSSSASSSNARRSPRPLRPCRPRSSIAGVVVAERERRPSLRIEVGRRWSASASGSGVLFRDDGYLITNAHVVSDATAISVILADGSQHEGSSSAATPTATSPS